MLVLVATTDTQGEVAGDYFQGVDGELVTPVTVECCVPDRCGCGRSFPGLVSARATTTALVQPATGTVSGTTAIITTTTTTTIAGRSITTTKR